ncbi:type II toxin-antitoxin system RelE/ParE family toxin [Haloferula sp. BvORR071]|uniref:type II toxin-antitoxin system RelE/ParE family toxin n=1 Tax=Haloferula sp. BvORR071 TaxID=1396141 RepID=UPI0005572043|nr:type II toxin-antitoxin system RelE/ParE family toxin [Haloferula sp. BvORR071]
MKVIFHRRIQRDLRTALDYYEAEAGAALGDRFFADAEAAVSSVLENPRGFHFVADGLRRASFKNFPYHFVFEEELGRVRFLVLRHDKRHPIYGLRRKW